MLENISDKLNNVAREIKGSGRLTELNINAALKDVKMALLEADVNYKVVKSFTENIKKKALGEDVLKSITPGQQFVKIVRDELCAILGGETSELQIKGKPFVIMMAGLQGAGKTTTCGKLAMLLKKQNKSIFLVPADMQRAGAVTQLKRVGEMANVDVFPSEEGKSSLDIVKEALKVAKVKAYDVVIVDTAGRLHIDEDLMDELNKVKKIINPNEVFFVADSMTGQDGVNTVKGFNEQIGITGVVLTKMDSDARGGAALSMKSVSNCPIKFAGIGERLEDFEVFHPDRLADRILDRGDILTLVEKAQENIDEKKAAQQLKRVKKGVFTLVDFKEQIQQMKKMGSLESMMGMIPGMKALKDKHDFKVDEKRLVRIEAIIDSMTNKERLNSKLLNMSRRKRIAKGSGTKVSDVNSLMKEFEQMKKMFKKFKGKDLSKGLGNMGGLGSLLGR